MDTFLCNANGCKKVARKKCKHNKEGKCRQCLNDDQKIYQLNDIVLGESNQALGINDKGAVVGFYTEQDDRKAFLWRAEKGAIDLGTLGGNDVVARSINNRGKITGESTTSPNTGDTRAFIWSKKKGIVALPTLGGNTTTGNAINDCNQIVGGSDTNLTQTHAFIWDKKSGMIDLGVLDPDGIGSEANDINTSGQVVGTTFDVDSRPQAFLWTEIGGMEGLGFPPDGVVSTAVSINDAGQVVGTFIDFEGFSHIFLWSRKTGMVDLTPIADAQNNPVVFFEVTAINNCGDVVGTRIETQPELIVVPFVYTDAEGFRDLPSLDLDKQGRADNINNNRVVVGSTSDIDTLGPFTGALWL